MRIFGSFIGLTLCLILINHARPILGERGLAENQLEEWRRTHRRRRAATNPHYAHVPSLTATIAIGDKGPLLLEDTNYQFHLSGFANERMPERVVHAKGAGAKGYFIVTHSMSNYTKAEPFRTGGQTTPVVVRLSSIAGNLGSADTVVDQRGFAVKFKTKAGNYDLLMVNLPVFQIRDPMLFPAVSRSRARNPATHLSDPEMFWDFTILRPESTFNVFLMNSNLGYFKSYRNMEGHSVNSFMWTGGTETSTDPVFVRYHLIPNEGKEIASIKTFAKLAETDPDYMIRTLYNDIAGENYPSWTLFVQIFRIADVQKATFDLFDPTKILFEKDFPMIPIGRLVLDVNPMDYFNDVEQTAFNVGNLIPGIEMSPDRLLQGRPFVYTHTQIHRLGVNNQQLPINRPKKGIKAHSYLRDGFMNINGNGDGGPNFFPNSFHGPHLDPHAKRLKFSVDGGVVDSVEDKDKDHFAQIDRYWREEMKEGERKKTIISIAKYLARTSRKTQERSLKTNWDPINPDIKRMMRSAVAKENSKNMGKRKPRASQHRNRCGCRRGQRAGHAQYIGLTNV